MTAMMLMLINFNISINIIAVILDMLKFISINIIAVILDIKIY